MIHVYRPLGSQTSLRPTFRRGELDRTRGRPAWARRYVDRMADLMDELEPR